MLLQDAETEGLQEWGLERHNHAVGPDLMMNKDKMMMMMMVVVWMMMVVGTEWRKVVRMMMLATMKTMMMMSKYDKEFFRTSPEHLSVLSWWVLLGRA